MREILFRGKRVDNGEWVYGFYIENETFDGKRIPQILSEYIAEKAVIPETVVQYTGLTDKNGKKIFEGDILSGQLDDLFPTEESIYEVVWHDYGWHIKNNSGMDTADKKWIKQYFKVIGNIHDNPELMGGEQALNKVSNANPKEKGRWVEKACFEHYGVESAEYECNKCAFLYVAPINAAKYDYCPNCGAKMGGVK